MLLGMVTAAAYYLLSLAWVTAAGGYLLAPGGRQIPE